MEYISWFLILLGVSILYPQIFLPFLNTQNIISADSFVKTITALAISTVLYYVGAGSSLVLLTTSIYFIYPVAYRHKDTIALLDKLNTPKENVEHTFKDSFNRIKEFFSPEFLTISPQELIVGIVNVEEKTRKTIKEKDEEPVKLLWKMGKDVQHVNRDGEMPIGNLSESSDSDDSSAITVRHRRRQLQRTAKERKSEKQTQSNNNGTVLKAELNQERKSAKTVIPIQEKKSLKAESKNQIIRKPERSETSTIKAGKSLKGNSLLAVEGKSLKGNSLMAVEEGKSLKGNSFLAVEEGPAPQVITPVETSDVGVQAMRPNEIDPRVDNRMTMLESRLRLEELRNKSWCIRMSEAEEHLKHLETKVQDLNAALESRPITSRTSSPKLSPQQSVTYVSLNKPTCDVQDSPSDDLTNSILGNRRKSPKKQFNADLYHDAGFSLEFNKVLKQIRAEQHREHAHKDCAENGRTQAYF